MLRVVPPNRLRSSLAGLALVAVLAAPLGALGTLVPAALRVAHAEGSFAPPEVTMAAESQALDLVNTDRAANGLPALEFDPTLATIARWRSEDMASRGYFSHDIGGYEVFQVLRDWGVAYRIAGENLAYNYYGQDAATAQAERALMDSPGHRANILRPDYTHLGVGVAVAADGRYLFTQLFRKEW